MEWRNGPYTLTDDSAKVDVPTVHAWLNETYWAQGRPLAVVQQTVNNSLCFSVFEGKQQVAFGRAVTDGLTFTWICDVVVREDMRSKGVGKWMMSLVVDHPAIRNTRQILGTRDAHGLYEKYGFLRVEYMRRNTV